MDLLLSPAFTLWSLQAFSALAGVWGGLQWLLGRKHVSVAGWQAWRQLAAAPR